MSKRNKNHRPGDGSTGPTSSAGKERCSRNAIAHGARSENHVILPNESAEEYAKVCQNWRDEFTPTDDLEAAMLKRLCERQWLAKRCERLYDDALTNTLLREPDSSKWTPEDHKHIQLMDRYRISSDRAYRTAWKDLETIRKNRVDALIQVERLKRLVFLNHRDNIRRKASASEPFDPLKEHPYVEEEQTPAIIASDDKPDKLRPLDNRRE